MGEEEVDEGRKIIQETKVDKNAPAYTIKQIKDHVVSWKKKIDFAAELARISIC